MKTRVTLYASSRCSTVGARDFYKKFPRSGSVRKDLLATAATRAKTPNTLPPIPVITSGMPRPRASASFGMYCHMGRCGPRPHSTTCDSATPSRSANERFCNQPACRLGATRNQDFGVFFLKRVVALRERLQSKAARRSETFGTLSTFVSAILGFSFDRAAVLKPMQRWISRPWNSLYPAKPVLPVFQPA